MLEVYCLNVTEPILETTFNELKKRVSAERLFKTEKFHFDIDKKRSIYSELLVKYIQRKYRIADLNLFQDISYNEFGKPFFLNEPSYHFNLAHSGEWVVCAWSSDEVGIDVEKITVDNFDLNVVTNFFSFEESQQIINEKDQKQQLQLFYKFWTLKESYLKFLGTGLSLDLKMIDFASKRSLLNQKNIYFYQEKLDAFHQLALCSPYQFGSNVIQVRISEIVNDN